MNEIDNTFAEIATIIQEARENAYRKINEELILMYQRVGKFLSEKSRDLNGLWINIRNRFCAPVTSNLYLCDKTLADDATQETFLRVYRTIDSFRGESSEVPVRTLMTRCEGTSCIQSGPIRNTSCSQGRGNGAAKELTTPDSKESRKLSGFLLSLNVLPLIHAGFMPDQRTWVPSTNR